MSETQQGARGWFRDGDYERALAELERARPESPWRRARERLAESRSARWSLRTLIAIVVLSLLAPLLPLPAPSSISVSLEPAPPQLPWEVFGVEKFEPDYWPLNPLDRAMVAVRTAAFGKWRTGHWLGTDALGRDVLARVVWGSRTSLLVALCAALTSVIIGATWGAVAGLSGGRIDNLMMRVVDVLFSIPTIFLVIFVLSFVGRPGESVGDEPLLSREQVFFLVVGAVTWLTMARVVRGQVLELERSAFVEAARASGASTLWILRMHVLPNVLGLVVVNLTLTLPTVILYEAFLSFLGLGVEPPRVSWGLLAAEGAESLNPLETYPWLILAPAAAMAITLLALQMLGDALRDAFGTAEQGPR